MTGQFNGWYQDGINPNKNYKTSNKYDGKCDDKAAEKCRRCTMAATMPVSVS